MELGIITDAFNYLKGDVYPVDTCDSSAVNQILDAHWGVLDDEDVSSLSLTLLLTFGKFSASLDMLEMHVHVWCPK